MQISNVKRQSKPCAGRYDGLRPALCYRTAIAAHRGPASARPHAAATDSVMHPRDVLLAALLAVSAAGCAGEPTGATVEGAQPQAATGEAAGVRTSPVIVGRPARVFVFAGLGKACEPLAEPELSITVFPTQGDISFKPGQDTTIAASAQGTCLGKTAKGTGVYYTARKGASGTDRFSVSAKLASGEVSKRDFEVRIEE